METQTLVARYQIEPYRGSPDKLPYVAVAFTGAPQSAREAGKVLLVVDPTSQHPFCYEFRTADIVYAEEGPNVVLPDGATNHLVRLWVRKGATALKLMPFHVQDTAQAMHELVGG